MSKLHVEINESNAIVSWKFDDDSENAFADGCIGILGAVHALAQNFGIEPEDVLERVTEANKMGKSTCYQVPKEHALATSMRSRSAPNHLN